MPIMKKIKNKEEMKKRKEEKVKNKKIDLYILERKILI